jgi:hypothetical protein
MRVDWGLGTPVNEMPVEDGSDAGVVAGPESLIAENEDVMQVQLLTIALQT